MRGIRETVDKLLKDIDVYIALFVALTASVIGAVGGRVDMVVNITSATLALIAFGALRDRNRAEHMREAVTRIEAYIEQDIHPKIVLGDENLHAGFAEIIKYASKEVNFLAHSPNAAWGIANVIEAALTRGCHIKIVICMPSDPIIGMLKSRAGSETEFVDKDEFTRQMHNLGDLAKDPRKSQIEIREIDYFTPMAIIISDPNDLKGEAFAPLVTFKAYYHETARIRVNHGQDPELFYFLKKQFDNYFNGATPLS